MKTMRSATLKSPISRLLSRKQITSNSIKLKCRYLSSPATSHTLQSVYTEKVAEGSLDYDENQFKLIKLLNKISTHLVNKQNREKEQEQHFIPIPMEEKNSAQGAKKSAENTVSESSVGNSAEHSAQPSSEISPEHSTEVIRRARGLYIYGDVGIGKTVVMDMFFDNCDIKAKKRVHFHQFMLDIHHKIHIYKKDLLAKYGRDVQLNMSSERDAITQVAEQISKECSLLCFDEFQVTDICDAMILSKLFSVLWSNGTVLVATSNRPPSDLYKDGLNRAYFMPFIHRLESECIVKQIESSKDYRQLNKPLPNSYYTPLTLETKTLLWDHFLSHSYEYRHPDEELYSPGKTIEKNVPVMMGRKVCVSTVSEHSRTCYVEFSYLCETDRGASDYHAICKNYDTIFLYGVPVLSVLEHDRARRFITLIDEIYDAGIHLIWASERDPNSIFKELTPVEIIVEKKEGRKFGTDHAWGADPNAIPGVKNTGTNAWLDQSAKTDIYPAVSHVYQGVDAANDELKLLEGELSSVQELKFAFRRAASRLTEMAGKEYLKNWKLKYKSG